jgi:hypothetical protein
MNLLSIIEENKWLKKPSLERSRTSMSAQLVTSTMVSRR